MTIHTRHIVRAGIAIVASTVVATSAGAVTRYRLTDLGVTPGSTSSVARTISQNGAIAGETGLGAGNNVGARFDGGAFEFPSLAGATNTVIRGINNGGVAAATVQTSGGDDRAALLTTGGATQLGNLAGFDAAGAFGVNNSGVATGYAYVAGSNPGLEGGLPAISNNLGAQQAVVWNGGVATALSNSGIGNSVGVAINDAGTVAGIARLTSPSNLPRAVSWDSAGLLTILPLSAGLDSSRARAISSNGAIAGQVSGVIAGNFNSYGAVWSGGTLTLLPNAANSDGTTRGINAAGTVVGFGSDADTGATTGQIWTLSGGSYSLTRLDSLVVNLGGWQTNAPQAINDAGQIVGLGLDPDGIGRAYLLTPGVPEPASWAMLIAGFGLIGGTARRRRAIAA